jgi:vacuolar protein sorting-associated protein 26
MNFFTTNPTIAFSFKDQTTRDRKLVRVPVSDPVEQLIYLGGEVVNGSVEIAVPSGKKVEHNGVKIELFGQIELINDRLSTPTKFTQFCLPLDQPGTLTGNKTYPFEFKGEKAFESYSGINVRCRYYLKCTVSRKYNNYSREVDFSVEIPQAGNASEALQYNNHSHLVNNNALTNPIKMEVGIEDCLHIEFGKYWYKI